MFDYDTNTWISDAQIAEIPAIAFVMQMKKSHHILGRLTVRRTQLHDTGKHATGQEELFAT